MAAPYASSIPAFMGGGAAPFANALPVVLVDANGNPIGGTNPLGFSQLTNAAGNGTVVINAAGDIDITPASGQDLEIAGGNGLAISSGTIGIAIAPKTASSIFLNNSLSGNSGGVSFVFQEGLNISATFGTDATDAAGVRIIPTIQAATALTNYAGITVGSGTTWSATSTVSNFVGYELDPQTFASSGITTFTGLQIQTPVFSGTAPTNVYGIRIRSMAGGTTNQALVTEGGQVSFTPVQSIASASGAFWNGVVVPATTCTITGSTNITNANGFNLFTINAPTLSNASINVTTATTLTIAGPPVLSGGMTATNLYTLRVISGTSRFEGAVSMSNTVSMGMKITAYNNVTTAGWGVAAVNAYVRSGTITNATTTLATFTPGADGSFLVSATVNVTVGTTMAMTVTCTYTDTAGNARTLTLPLVNAGTTVFLTNGSIITTGDYMSVQMHIRAKASAAITLQTAGTVTTTTYTAEAAIVEVA